MAGLYFILFDLSVIKYNDPAVKIDPVGLGETYNHFSLALSQHLDHLQHSADLHGLLTIFGAINMNIRTIYNIFGPFRTFGSFSTFELFTTFELPKTLELFTTFGLHCIYNSWTIYNSESSGTIYNSWNIYKI